MNLSCNCAQCDRKFTLNISSTVLMHHTYETFKCFLMPQVSYLSWGVIQERIMTRAYGKTDENTGERFNNSQFLVFINRYLHITIVQLKDIFVMFLISISRKITNWLYNYWLSLRSALLGILVLTMSQFWPFRALKGLHWVKPSRCQRVRID